MKSIESMKPKTIEKDQLHVGCIGHPNVGKSSLINGLKGEISWKFLE